MSIGEIADFQIGTQFADRRELYDFGIHRALQADIVGQEAVGAESIVLSGGYVDDADYGSSIIYTGGGGRDPNSGRQIADQEFTRKNKSLVTSCLQGLPVRVIRGSGHKSEHSPAAGYR
ncbi:MAG: YDG/SRA domain-containing protein [Paracoccaceae bacterium]|nr:YDG/SRA domain-containing protein [Paracoccaceae bacterium]